MDVNADAVKEPFDIDVVMDRVREAIAPFPNAGLFELAEDGFSSVFEQLVACIISIRTLDEVMLPAARRLFERARTPAETLTLTTEEIGALIQPAMYYENKAVTIREIARRAVEEHGGTLPCDEATLLSFKGVGPKCANLVLSIACNQPRIGVDTHVHRITNRWGYVAATKTPEATLAILIETLPREYWVEINRLLVPFGKHVCTGKLPRCSECPVLEYCQQVGVDRHR